MRRHGIAAVALVVVSVSACQMGGPSRQTARQTGIEGEWVDANGVAMSTLSGGGFRSVAVDTGQQLSTGSYTYRDSQTIDLVINSIIRGTTTQATCAQVTVDQLNCTNSAGVQFVLRRRPVA